MKKIYSVLVRIVFAFLLFSALSFAFGMKADAAGLNTKKWDYKNEKVSPSAYDKYSGISSFKNSEWKLLSEQQLIDIANHNGRVDIKSYDFASGEVLFGMKTDNLQLAFWAFKNMTVNGKQSPYLGLEKITNYAGTGGSIIVVRCDPSSYFTSLKRTSIHQRETDGDVVGFVYTIVNPKQDFTINFSDSSPCDKATISYKYSYQKRAGNPSVYDVVLEITVSKKIKHNPPYHTTYTQLKVNIKEYLFPKQYNDYMNFVYSEGTEQVNNKERLCCYVGIEENNYGIISDVAIIHY